MPARAPAARVSTARDAAVRKHLGVGPDAKIKAAEYFRAQRELADREAATKPPATKPPTAAKPATPPKSSSTAPAKRAGGRPRKTSTARRIPAPVRAGARQAVAPARHAVTTGTRIVVLTLGLVALYWALTNAAAVASALDRAVIGLDRLADPERPAVTYHPGFRG